MRENSLELFFKKEHNVKIGKVGFVLGILAREVTEDTF